MNWKNFWQQQAQVSDPLLQVGRMGGHTAQPDSWLAEYAAYIAQQLNLTPADTLLDVCCGNGLLTHHLAAHCKAVLGVDFSASHIDFAKQNFATDVVQFRCLDALELGNTVFEEPLFRDGFTQSSLCFAFQYFESIQAGLQVVKGMVRHTHQRIFLGDIPDRSRFLIYYNSPVKLARLVKQMLMQRNDMGKFWSEGELAYIAGMVNGQGRLISQPETFPYAHYRMDYMIDLK